MAESFWEVRNLRPSPQGTRRAFFSLFCPPLKIHNVAFHHDGSRSWLEFPQQPVLGPDGDLTRAKDGRLARRVIVDFADRETKAAITAWAVGEVERRLSQYLQDVAAQQAFAAQAIVLKTSDEN